MLIMYARRKPDTADHTVQKGPPPPPPQPHIHSSHREKKKITFSGLNGSLKNIQQAFQCFDYTAVDFLRSMLLLLWRLCVEN